MACTFFKAMGYEIGESKCEDDKLEEANRILKLAEEKKCKTCFTSRQPYCK